MSDLLKRLKKAGTVKNSNVLSKSKFFGSGDLVKTDIMALNIALSGSIDGGLSYGLTIIAGPSKHFKSNISLIAVKAYLNKYDDAVCLFYDSEFGSTPDYFESVGVDIDRVIHIPIEDVEQLKFDCSKRLQEIQEGDHVIIFIDSLGTLASKKEIDDALSEKSVADMTRAKAIRSFFRIITPHLSTKKIPCIAVNHTYQEMALYPKTVVGGGCLVEGTMVQTSQGMKPIEQFKIGDRVITLDGEKDVKNVWVFEDSEAKECLEIVFDDNFIVVCSEEHKFFVDGKWIEARNLNPGDDCEVAE